MKRKYSRLNICWKDGNGSIFFFLFSWFHCGLYGRRAYFHFHISHTEVGEKFSLLLFKCVFPLWCCVLPKSSVFKWCYQCIIQRVRCSYMQRHIRSRVYVCFQPSSLLLSLVLISCENRLHKKSVKSLMAIFILMLKRNHCKCSKERAWAHAHLCDWLLKKKQKKMYNIKHWVKCNLRISAENGRQNDEDEKRNVATIYHQIDFACIQFFIQQVSETQNEKKERGREREKDEWNATRWTSSLY